MAKLIVFLITFLFSFQSFAKSECELRLSNPLPHAPETELETENVWIGNLGGTLNDPRNAKWSADNIQQRWTSWRGLTRNQRDQAMTLELLKISPRVVASQQTVQFLGRDDLKVLSAINKERMLKKVDELFPVSPAALENADLLKTANKLAVRVQFSYGRPVNPLQFTVSPVGYDAPIASPRELAALDLDTQKSFYSALVGTSPSIEFDVMATKGERSGAAGEIATLLRRETFVLKGKFARDNGYSLPAFRGISDMLDFFDFWDPKGSEEVFRANWTNLPKDVKTYADFRAYMELHGEDFPSASAYHQLAPLRMRLRQYIMTTEDSEDLLRQAFNRYVMSIGAEDALLAEDFLVKLSNSGAIMRFFRDKFFAALHMPSGMMLRIPIAVSDSDYTLSRVADAPFLSRPATVHGVTRNEIGPPPSKP